MDLLEAIMLKRVKSIIFVIGLLGVLSVQAVHLVEPSNAETVKKRNEQSSAFIKDFCASQGVEINSLESCTSLLLENYSGNAGIGYNIFTGKTSLKVGYGYGLTPFVEEIVLPQKQREFMMTHECAHRTNRDHEKKYVYLAVNPLLASSVGAMNRSAGRSKVFAGVAALVTSVCHIALFPQWAKQCEFKADAASKDPEVLKAGIQLLKRWQQEDTSQVATLSPVAHIKNYLTTFHPSHAERIERLEDQIKKIK